FQRGLKGLNYSGDKPRARNVLPLRVQPAEERLLEDDRYVDSFDSCRPVAFRAIGSIHPIRRPRRHTFNIEVIGVSPRRASVPGDPKRILAQRRFLDLALRGHPEGVTRGEIKNEIATLVKRERWRVETTHRPELVDVGQKGRERW